MSSYGDTLALVASKYYPILLTCQMHTDYTVSAHNIHF